MRFRRNYKNKSWFGMMWVNSYNRRLFGRRAIRMLVENSLFKHMHVNVKPRCWCGE